VAARHPRPLEVDTQPPLSFFFSEFYFFKKISLFIYF